MALDLVPNNIWRFPSIPSVWEDIDEWYPITPQASAPLSGLSISEDDKNVYIEAAVPGVDPRDVEVTVHKGILWIKADGREEEKKKKFYRKATSSFSYRVTIPEDVDMTKDPDGVCKNGVMMVTFARAPKTQPKKITVRAVGEEKKNGQKK